MIDLRTIELIEYGLVKAERIIAFEPDICLELAARYITFDTETTGLDPERDRIVELGAVLFENGQPAESFQSYVNSGTHVSDEVSAISHITNEVLQGAPSEEEVYPQLMAFLGDAANGETLICGHVAAFARKTFGMYGGQDRKLTLEGENYLAGVVIDRFGADVMMYPYEENKFHASVTVTISPQFFGWLAGLGKGIRISWPDDVRKEYKAFLQGIVESMEPDKLV